MGYFSNQIRDACALLGYSCSVLSRDEALGLHLSIENKFAAPGTIAMWDRLRDDEAIYDPDGWSRVCDFIQGERVFIFFELDDDDTAVHLEDGTHLTEILEECIPFVFYVTDEAQDYLLSFNDHDILIGAGTAKAFVQKLRESRSSE